MIKKGEIISDIQKVKELELKILDEIISFCNERGYICYIAYGTLLGAVRHKGFIPWDDDIDVIMPRNDYEKFCAEWDNSGRYKVLECKRDSSYIYPFAKVFDSTTIIEEHDVLVGCNLGIYVDVFPQDNVPYKTKNECYLIKKCETLEKCRMYSMFRVDKILSKDKKKNIMRRIIWKILKGIGPARISRYQDKVAQKYKDDDTDYIGCLCTRYSEREILPVSIYKDETTVMFEGKKYKTPANYDYILKLLYGDYMEFPPVEERVLKHNFKVWEVEED